MSLLKRKAEIISKIFAKQGKTEELLQYMVGWASSEVSNGRQFAMYLFEVLSDCHLSNQQLTTYKDNFMTIFSTSLSDKDLLVRVAALKATISFLTSIDDSDIILGFQGIVPPILNTVVESLKENEEQGRQALESMQELTNSCPELWRQSTTQLVNVISQVMA